MKTAREYRLLAEQLAQAAADRDRSDPHVYNRIRAHQKCGIGMEHASQYPLDKLDHTFDTHRA